jgi:hypothetical protein
MRTARHDPLHETECSRGIQSPHLAAHSPVRSPSSERRTVFCPYFSNCALGSSSRPLLRSNPALIAPLRCPHSMRCSEAKPEDPWGAGARELRVRDRKLGCRVNEQRPQSVYYIMILIRRRVFCYRFAAETSVWMPLGVGVSRCERGHSYMS